MPLGDVLATFWGPGGKVKTTLPPAREHRLQGWRGDKIRQFPSIKGGVFFEGHRKEFFGILYVFCRFLGSAWEVLFH